LFEANAVTDKTDVELLTTVQSVANVDGTSGAIVSEEQLAAGPHDKTINMTFAINASGGATAVNIGTGYVVKVFTMNDGWESGGISTQETEGPKLNVSFKMKMGTSGGDTRANIAHRVFTYLIFNENDGIEIETALINEILDDWTQVTFEKILPLNTNTVRIAFAIEPHYDPSNPSGGYSIADIGFYDFKYTVNGGAEESVPISQDNFVWNIDSSTTQITVSSYVYYQHSKEKVFDIVNYSSTISNTNGAGGAKQIYFLTGSTTTGGMNNISEYPLIYYEASYVTSNGGAIYISTKSLETTANLVTTLSSSINVLTKEIPSPVYGTIETGHVIHVNRSREVVTINSYQHAFAFWVKRVSDATASTNLGHHGFVCYGDAEYGMASHTLDTVNGYQYSMTIWGSNGPSHVINQIYLSGGGHNWVYATELDTWYHMVIVTDGTQFKDQKLYINGDEITPQNTNNTTALPVLKPSTVAIGNQNSTFNNTYVHDLAIFTDISITPTDVQSMYQNGNTSLSNKSPLIHYPFDESDIFSANSYEYDLIPATNSSLVFNSNIPN
jgi:hypothetical protein